MCNFVICGGFIPAADEPLLKGEVEKDHNIANITDLGPEYFVEVKVRVNSAPKGRV